MKKKRWSETEIKLLIQNYSSSSIYFLESLLQRSRRSIWKKASDLLLSKPLARYHSISKKQLEELYLLQKLSIPEIAKYFQFSKEEIYQALNKFGIKRLGRAALYIGKHDPNWKGYGCISNTQWNKIKYSAKSRKIIFDITIEYAWKIFLKQEQKCIYSGLELNFPIKASKYDGTASLDRIDSSKGYNKDNIQWIHKQIQPMKMNMKEEDFLNLVKLIARNKKLI